jgi:hypothetical protein
MEKYREDFAKGEPSQELRKTPPATRFENLLPLEQVHDEDFEEICRVIAKQETGVVRANFKRKRGVGQFGADVEGFSEDQLPILVVSAKRYKTIRPHLLEKWGHAFRNCWQDQWEGKGVERFVIAVTVKLNNDSLNTEIRNEVVRFKELGIQYDIWGLDELTEKLSTRPDIIGKYMHPAWVEVISNRLPQSQPDFTLQLSLKGPLKKIRRLSDDVVVDLAVDKAKVLETHKEPELTAEQNVQPEAQENGSKRFLSEEEMYFRQEAEQKQSDANPDLLAGWLEWRAKDLNVHANAIRIQARDHTKEARKYSYFASNLWDKIKTERKSGSDDLAETLSEEWRDLLNKSDSEVGLASAANDKADDVDLTSDIFRKLARDAAEILRLKARSEKLGCTFEQCAIESSYPILRRARLYRGARRLTASVWKWSKISALLLAVMLVLGFCARLSE